MNKASKLRVISKLSASRQEACKEIFHHYQLKFWAAMKYKNYGMAANALLETNLKGKERLADAIWSGH